MSWEMRQTRRKLQVADSGPQAVSDSITEPCSKGGAFCQRRSSRMEGLDQRSVGWFASRQKIKPGVGRKGTLSFWCSGFRAFLFFKQYLKKLREWSSYSYRAVDQSSSFLTSYAWLNFAIEKQCATRRSWFFSRHCIHLCVISYNDTYTHLTDLMTDLRWPRVKIFWKCGKDAW